MTRGAPLLSDAPQHAFDRHGVPLAAGRRNSFPKNWSEGGISATVIGCWRCMIPASDEAGVPQQGGIFVKAIASRREDSRYSSDTAQSRGHKWVTAIHLNS